MIRAAWKEITLTPKFELGTSKGPINARTVWYLIAWDSDRPEVKGNPKGLMRMTLAAHPYVVAEDFPGYVPDLNPDEGVWGWTKYGRLANLAAENTDELWDRVMEELVTAKHSPDLLNGFLRQTELPGLSLAV